MIALTSMAMPPPIKPMSRFDSVSTCSMTDGVWGIDESIIFAFSSYRK